MKVQAQFPYHRRDHNREVAHGQPLSFRIYFFSSVRPISNISHFPVLSSMNIDLCQLLKKPLGLSFKNTQAADLPYTGDLSDR